ncbi:Serine acetyltransferase [Porphyridium purpureum]|uniref:serine O-acetyltransferase n=1 Tax=Porphyridium purpureum TaxID=35688 RepID=A0A5J4YK39_PORPP|nr:Serine acetyltransferase [Porphyridium purpureum]|eukprot:POR8289..scf244_11
MAATGVLFVVASVSTRRMQPSRHRCLSEERWGFGQRVAARVRATAKGHVVKGTVTCATSSSSSTPPSSELFSTASDTHESGANSVRGKEDQDDKCPHAFLEYLCPERAKAFHDEEQTWRSMRMADFGTPGTAGYIRNVRSRGSCFRKCLVACRKDTSNRDVVWDALRNEAFHYIQMEPLLSSQIFSAVVNQKSIGSAISYILANQLASELLSSVDLHMMSLEVILDDPQIACQVREDLLAEVLQNPACEGFLSVLLHSKGFHALQAYRVSHHLWNAGFIPAALMLNLQIANYFQVDIHPAAKVGSYVFIDHATCVVIGETAVVGNGVSLLQHVTLGGVGRSAAKRHPTIEDGVLIAAGATILGDVRVGTGAKISSCSLVLNDVPAKATAMGVPANVFAPDEQLDLIAFPELLSLGDSHSS